jgi:hypothetical protein
MDRGTSNIWTRIGAMNLGTAPFQAPRLGGWKAALPTTGSWVASNPEIEDAWGP